MSAERGILRTIVEFDPKPVSMALGIGMCLTGVVLRDDTFASVGLGVFLGTCMGEAIEQSIEKSSGADKNDPK